MSAAAVVHVDADDPVGRIDDGDGGVAARKHRRAAPKRGLTTKVWRTLASLYFVAPANALSLPLVAEVAEEARKLAGSAISLGGISQPRKEVIENA